MSEQTIEPRKRTLPEHPVNIRSLAGELSEDKRKVRVSVELSRDDTRPDLDLVLADANGMEISHATIIENFGAGMDFTLHIRTSQVRFPLTLNCRLSYVDEEIASEMSVSLSED
jgi:hypothetical protein